MTHETQERCFRGNRSMSSGAIPVKWPSSDAIRCGLASRMRGQRDAKEPPDSAKSKRLWLGANARALDERGQP
jgi:hypothetical protein